MNNIKFNDLLHLSEEQISSAKVRFNTPAEKDKPIELYKTDPDIINKRWLYWRNKKRYFEVGEIAICLVRIYKDNWLLTTIDTVDDEIGVVNGINYTGTPFQEYTPYYGRTIIKFHKDRPNLYNLSLIKDELEVVQILPDTFDDDDFPGYDKVSLSYEQLKSILDRGKKDWISALSNQKAVYLISDTNTGKLYVGKASAKEGMLLERWSAYVKNGHGGNKELELIVQKEGFDYVRKNFKYSILENYNAKIDDSVILDRERWWKKVLLSYQFGYNDNL